MVNVDEIYGAGNLNVEIVKKLMLEGKILTIESAEVQDVGREEVKQRVILNFEEIDPGLVVGSTNNKILKASWGNETDKWLGHQLQLIIYKTNYEGKDGIQVKPV